MASLSQREQKIFRGLPVIDEPIDLKKLKKQPIQMQVVATQQLSTLRWQRELTDFNESLRTLCKVSDSPSPSRTLTLDRIARTVADHYQVTVLDIRSQRRDALIIRPRQIVVFLARTMTMHSLPSIGRYLGGRDHTTMMSSVKRILNLRKADPELDGQVAFLIYKLSA